MSRDALIVGISNYKTLPTLSAPAHDAEDVARCIESFGECRVVRLPEAIDNHKPIVSQQAGVTTQMLEAALIRLFKPSGKNIPQTAIFYFSGHGLQRNAGIQEGYLATSDTNPESGNYGLSLYWLRRLLQESPVRQRVVILDCCNSGEFFNIIEADPGAKSGTDRLFMAASREYEEAYESLSSSHSVFTQALISGLNPYKVKGNMVNGHSLIDSVNNQLKGELQQPLFESSGSEIVLTRAVGQISRPEPADVSALDRLQQGLYKYCPFQGVAPFQASHGNFFFGREDLTQKLSTMAQASRLSAVTGASGIGKTSLLQAGLISTLSRQNQNDAGIHWDIRYVSLGADPLKQLAEVFIDPQVSGLQRAEQIRTAESFFHNRAQGMTQLVQASLSRSPTQESNDARILLVIDQFDTLFAATDDATLTAQRQAVIDCLTAVVHKPHVPMHIVLGLRSQHLPALEAFPELHHLVGQHCLWVPPMTYDQLKSTITSPLEKLGLQYDANLIYTLLLDVVGAPGELALLQMALKYLWQHREQPAGSHLPPRLTLESYVKLGGVRQILRNHATAFIENLPTVEKPVAERILLSACEFGEGSTPSRRQVHQEELVTHTISTEQILETLDKLLAARLIISHTDYDCTVAAPSNAQTVPAWNPATQGPQQSSPFSQLFHHHQALTDESPDAAPYFEVCHDSLLHNWPIFEEWLQRYRPLMKTQRSIEAAAMEWQQYQKPDHPDYLLSRTRLAQALMFQVDQGDHLSALAHEYLSVCHQQSRRMKRKRYLMRLLIPLSMGMGMLTAYGYSRIAQFQHVSAPVSVGTADATGQLSNPAQPQPSTDGRGVAARGQSDAARVSDQAETVATASHSGMTPDWSRGLPLKSGNGTQRLRPSLSGAMANSVTGLQSWQRQIGQVAITQPPKSAVEAPSNLALTTLDEILKPVAQLVSPSDPAVMIQVWCTQSSTDPMCFASPFPANSPPGTPMAPL